MAAAAEARAVWQRTANRYFVHEDAKRAPKLACRSSASSLLSHQSETKPANNTTDEENDRFPPPKKSLFSDVSPDSRWWLQLQPDYINQRGLTNSYQFVENEDGGTGSLNSVSKESFEVVDINKDSKFHGERPWWQITGKDDLGLLISKKSHDCIENRHLSRPKETGVREIELSKAKILEALRHSQTRAREAENAAKEAYAEKEHVIKVVLRQASELFACRQWIRLLQIENLYYQIKNDKSNPVSSSSKSGKLQKKMKKGKRRRERFEDNLGKFAVVFVMGLGLVGAGLLVGWTVGWMLI